MAKAKTPSYVLELELQTNQAERVILEKKIKIAKQIYNACLGFALKRLAELRSDKEYHVLVADKSAKGRTKRLKEIERSHGYSEYQLHAFVAPMQAKYAKNMGSLEAQKLATRAFKSVEKLKYHQAKRVHFKRPFDDMSVENKNNATGIRFDGEFLLWGKKNAKGSLKLKVFIKPNDEYAHMALCDKTKYCRVVMREIRGKPRFFVQLIQEGLPPTKRDKDTGLEKNPVDTFNSRVGIDMGTSTGAVVSEDKIQLVELAEACKADAKELRRMERAMDRSKRATNPHNFKENGVVKKGVKWSFSNRYMKRKAKRKDLHRKIATKRKQAHEELANDILSQGSDVRVETMRFQSLQKKAKKTTRNKKNGRIDKKKRFGKSLLNHAPAMLITILDRKLGYQGKSVKKIDTYATKASQFNHKTGEYTKKQLEQRWNDIQGLSIQRDLYSAFLIGNTTDSLDSIDVDLCDSQWEQFVELHNREIARLQQSTNKTLHWFVKPDKQRKTAVAV
ncbi:Probable transposase [Gracilibacillus orientalis]|uniref:Probable transposase n=1 Tax=Gracilibacillus orientalis TaxID=334253 RepID=A0A1I4HWQ0_9BACI|nr:transposase [Gracilibacillus orientalis]SFL46147.1 Probable transposase [Gracilibacillus orientalis]